MEMERFSYRAERLSDDIYRKIIGLPFVRTLADGSLPEEKFIFYLQQDSLYVSNYARVLAHAALRLPEEDMRMEFLRFATVGVEFEQFLHKHYLRGNCLSDKDISPVCLFYNSWHRSHACDPVEVEAAGLLPCFTIYGKVGKHILDTAKPGNPYMKWIVTYNDPDFQAQTESACRICDRLYLMASDSVKDAMIEAFITGCRMEWLFWDSAWNLRRWQI